MYSRTDQGAERALFLADRTALANQAANAFTAHLSAATTDHAPTGPDILLPEARVAVIFDILGHLRRVLCLLTGLANRRRGRPSPDGQADARDVAHLSMRGPCHPGRSISPVATTQTEGAYGVPRDRQADSDVRAAPTQGGRRTGECGCLIVEAVKRALKNPSHEGTGG